MAVHEIEKAQRRAIHQRRFVTRRDAIHPDQCRFRGISLRGDCLCYLYGGRSASARDHAAKRVEKPSAAFPHHFSRQILEANRVC